MFGEAVVYFNKEFAEIRKYKHEQSMQLPSKTRFISARFDHLLRKRSWQKATEQGNKMAQLLANELKVIDSVEVTKPVQVNAVLPEFQSHGIMNCRVLCRSMFGTNSPMK